MWTMYNGSIAYVTEALTVKDTVKLQLYCIEKFVILENLVSNLSTF